MKCPKCGAEAYMTEARPKAGRDPSLREYQCRSIKGHRFVAVKGKRQLASSRKVPDEHGRLFKKKDFTRRK